MNWFDWLRYELLGLPKPRLGKLKPIPVYYRGGRVVNFYKLKEKRGEKK